MAIARMLSSLGWLLVLVGAPILVVTPWLPSSTLEPFKNAVPAGIIIALAGHLLTQARSAKDAAEKKSQFYLDACVEAYEQARNLVADGNNDRITWIAAGRALVLAKELANRVNVDVHVRVLELQKLSAA